MLAVLAAQAGCIPKEDPNAPAVQAPARPPGPNPLAGEKLFVDPGSQAKAAADGMRASNPADAALLDRIAREPQAFWFGEWSGDVGAAVDQAVSSAADAGALAVLVLYDIPNRDCGLYSKGGAASAEPYRAWIRSAASGIRGRRAAVVLEPDALGNMTDCLAAESQDERLALLAEAVSVLAAQRSAAIYIDGGNARWHPAEEMASRLSRAGIAGADGFTLNVSNYVSTDETIAYGKAISERLGGKHFVVDTSRNGNGPTPDSQWCNPDGRALGAPPTTGTGDPLVDAYLWVKRPGESDGECNGGPRAGMFWVEQALGMARRAKGP